MKKYLIAIGLFLGAAVGGTVMQPAFAAFWQWSTTASNNATADPTINWSEGMSPSSVNDSARAMMARAAEWRNDVSGTLGTSGSGTAYVVTTQEGLNATPAEGQMLSLFVTATNGANPTLTVDGGTTYPIWSPINVPIPPGTMIANSQYRMRFTTSGGWLVEGLYASPNSIPIGGMIDFTGDNSPNSNFILPAGQCISRTTYATYFAMIGTRFSACDGTTTFGVPDHRGRVAAVIDNLGGTPAGRITATTGGCSAAFNSVGVVCGQQGITLSQGNLPAIAPTFNGTPATITVRSAETSYWFVGSPQQLVAASGVIGIQNAQQGQVVSTGSYTPAGSISALGSNVPFPTLPPIIAVSKLLRVL